MATNKARGTAWETAVVRYLNTRLGQTDGDGRFISVVDSGNIRRQVQTGAKDTGDIWAYPWILEAKNVAKIDLPGFIRQANSEALNAGAEYGAAVIKKRNASVADGYVVLDLRTFASALDHMRNGMH